MLLDHNGFLTVRKDGRRGEDKGWISGGEKEMDMFKDML